MRALLAASAVYLVVFLIGVAADMSPATNAGAVTSYGSVHVAIPAAPRTPAAEAATLPAVALVPRVRPAAVRQRAAAWRRPSPLAVERDLNRSSLIAFQSVALGADLARSIASGAVAPASGALSRPL